MSQQVLFETRDDICVVTINRPERRNAIGIDTRTRLEDAFLKFEADAGLRVAILTGTGDQAFCAGMDLKEAVELGVTSVPRMPTLGDNLHVTKPVIAAVNGVAFAGGWLLAQMCDLCVAAGAARFGITEAKVGRGFAWATPLFEMIPPRVALELLMTGRSISAERAYQLGFVNEVATDGPVLDCALKMAREIADNAPLVVAAAKEISFLYPEMGRSAALKQSVRVFEDKVYHSEDAQEGPKAFLEKRRPVWKAR